MWGRFAGSASFPKNAFPGPLRCRGAEQGLIPARGCRRMWEHAVGAGAAVSPACPVPVLVSGRSPSPFLPAELFLPPSFLLPKESLARGLFLSAIPRAACPVLPQLSKTIRTWDEANDGMSGLEGVWGPPKDLQCSYTAAPAGILGDIFLFPPPLQVNRAVPNPAWRQRTVRAFCLPLDPQGMIVQGKTPFPGKGRAWMLGDAQGTAGFGVWCLCQVSGHLSEFPVVCSPSWVPGTEQGRIWS